MVLKLKIPDLSDSVCPECRPVVEALQQIIVELSERVQILEDEIKELKNQKKKPKFKPSGMDDNTDPDNDGNSSNKGKSGKRKGKRSKTSNLQIHNEKVIEPEGHIPSNAQFIGYKTFVVQELEINNINICYKMARYRLADGTIVSGQLPAELKGSHFGTTLRTYVLYQHHHCQVTQSLLLEQLREWGVDISAGQLNRLLSEKYDDFHQEKDDLLNKGLGSTGYITTDDTGGRHQGKNGFVTHIGNELFAWFQSSRSKSRVNFLSLLCADQLGYRINDTALNYMKQQRLPFAQWECLTNHPCQFFNNEIQWQEHLQQLGFSSERHIRCATEGALFAQAVEVQPIESLVVVSDGAGQFKVLIHALCWVHAERLIHNLIPLCLEHRSDIKKVRNEIWDFYRELKRYKVEPCAKKAEQLSQRFDDIFMKKTSYQTLNQQLKRLHKHKSSLLRVLERPEIPIHTNGSENDLREHVKRRKISGGTRSDLGRRCRDTFSSLRKTCQKQNLSFWAFLNDRLSLKNTIPLLGDLVLQGSRTTTTY